MSEWFLEAANHTCGNYDRGVNEIELTGLTPMPSVRVGHFAQGGKSSNHSNSVNCLRFFVSILILKYITSKSVCVFWHGSRFATHSDESAQIYWRRVHEKLDHFPLIR